MEFLYLPLVISNSITYYTKKHMKLSLSIPTSIIHSSYIIFYYNIFITFLKRVNNISLTTNLKTKIPIVKSKIHMPETCCQNFSLWFDD